MEMVDPHENTWIVGWHTLCPRFSFVFFCRPHHLRTWPHSREGRTCKVVERCVNPGKLSALVLISNNGIKESAGRLEDVRSRLLGHPRKPCGFLQVRNRRYPWEPCRPSSSYPSGPFRHSPLQSLALELRSGVSDPMSPTPSDCLLPQIRSSPAYAHRSSC